jgi:hypothetical protein
MSEYNALLIAGFFDHRGKAEINSSVMKMWPPVWPAFVSARRHIFCLEHRGGRGCQGSLSPPPVRPVQAEHIPPIYQAPARPTPVLTPKSKLPKSPMLSDGLVFTNPVVVDASGIIAGHGRRRSRQNRWLSPGSDRAAVGHERG